MKIKKLVIILLVSLIFSIILSTTSVRYQSEGWDVCFALTGKMNLSECYEPIQSGGFPLKFIERGDVNSPANNADFRDGANWWLFSLNTFLYFLFITPYLVLIENRKKILI